MATNPVKHLCGHLINKPIPIDVWIQGTIESTIGNDIIISDSTGKVKVTKCDSSGAVKGTYCCVIGVAINTKSMPDIQATKFINLNSLPQMKLSWETEVREAQLFLEGKVIPQI